MIRRFYDKDDNELTVVQSSNDFHFRPLEAVRHEDISPKEYAKHLDKIKKNAVKGDPIKDKLDALIAENASMKADIAKLKANNPSK